MVSIAFETKEALFTFDAGDVCARLVYYSNKHQVKEAADLLRFLESSSGEPKRIPSEKGYFGYIVLDLLGKGKGAAFCKTCPVSYTHLTLPTKRIV